MTTTTSLTTAIKKQQKEVAHGLALETSLSGRLASIDGWRAVSILFVLIQHSAALPGWPTQFKSVLIAALGGVGVRFFFVISGFLITWLLMMEHQKTGTVSLKAFYIRRTFRIFPVLYLYLCISFVFQLIKMVDVPPSAYLVAATFMGDFWKLSHPFGHLWSLGVEEKFYIIWPFLFLLMFRRKTSKLITVLIIAMAVAPVLRAVADTQNLGKTILFNFHSFFIIFDGLAIGCLGAILLKTKEQTTKKLLFENKFVLFLLACIAIAAPASFWILPSLKSLQPLQDTLQCTGFLVLLMQSICFPHFFLYKLLNNKFIMHIGLISYSLYIWMGVGEIKEIYKVSDFAAQHQFPIWLVVVFVLAEISYYLAERPMLKLRDRFL